MIGIKLVYEVDFKTGIHRKAVSNRDRKYDIIIIIIT